MKADRFEILAREIDAASRRPFGWGKHDCCMFAAGIVLAMTGVDLAKGLRGYRTGKGAYKVLRRRGAGNLSKTLTAVTKAAGFKPVKPNFARRGDLVMAQIETDHGVRDAAGICLGAHAAFASDGLAFVPITETSRAWRIEHG